MKIEFKPSGICARKIEAEVENGIVKDIQIIGGCDGNHKGLRMLVQGRPVDEVIEKLEGITCGFRHTSCPDQLAKALKTVK